jgi:phosphoribosylformylglycinamidine cyclo-ligase
MAQREQMTYEQAGVSTAEGARAVDAIKAVVKATYRPEVIGDLGGFGGLFSAAAFKDMEDPILVSGTDGVGTKLKLAQRLGVYDTVGIDLVAMCVNDIVVSGAEPLFFLDYVAIGKLESTRMAQIVSGIADGCRQAGCALIGGEMAEHPGVMDPDDYDLSGFAVGVVDRPKMIGPDHVCAGDIILGLASSGVHSNGFSLVRRAVLDRILTDDELLEPLSELGNISLGEALLAPTRIYVRPVVTALAAGLPLHAAAHITGGGITENLDRALPAGLDAEIELGSWPNSPVISYVATEAALSQEEMLKTFNCGIGLCLICPPEAAASVRAHFEEAGETVFQIGHIVAGTPATKGKVVYR